MNWIKLTDKLPPENKGVLVFARGVIATARMYHYKDGIYWSGEGFGGYEWDFDFQKGDVTHWMFLPKPPA